MLYYKLGDLAGVFSDPVSEITILPKQVVAIEKAPKHRKFREALKGGHIQSASQHEYEMYLDEFKVEDKAKRDATLKSGTDITKKVKELANRELELAKREEAFLEKESALAAKEAELGNPAGDVLPKNFPPEKAVKDDYLKWAEEYGFDEDDMAEIKAIKKVKELRTTVIELSKNYDES